MDRPAQHLYSVVRHLSAKYTQGGEERSGGGRAGIEVYAYNHRRLRHEERKFEASLENIAKSCLKNKAEQSLQGNRIPVDSEAPNCLLCYEALRLLKKGEGMRNGKGGGENVIEKLGRQPHSLVPEASNAGDRVGTLTDSGWPLAAPITDSLVSRNQLRAGRVKWLSQ